MNQWTVQRQTAVTAHLKSEHLLLFSFAGQQCHGCPQATPSQGNYPCEYVPEKRQFAVMGVLKAPLN